MAKVERWNYTCFTVIEYRNHTKELHHKLFYLDQNALFMLTVSLVWSVEDTNIYSFQVTFHKLGETTNMLQLHNILLLMYNIHFKELFIKSKLIQLSGPLPSYVWSPRARWIKLILRPWKSEASVSEDKSQREVSPSQFLFFLCHTTRTVACAVTANLARPPPHPHLLPESN